MRGAVQLFATALLASQALAAPAVEEKLPELDRRAPASAPHFDIPTCKSTYPPGVDAQQAVPVFPQAATAKCPVYANQTITIPLYLVLPYFDNGVNGTKTPNNNYITPTLLKKPVEHMNENFKQYKPRIQFTIQPIKYIKVTNATLWEEYHNIGTDTQEDFDRLERVLVQPVRGPLASRTKDQYRRLYVYIPPSLNGATGFAFLPYSTTPFSADGVYFDGGSWLRSLSTLTHETGHWMSLLHTHQGGCTGSGDLVADTPPWDLSGDINALSCVKARQWGLPYDYNKIVNPCGGTKAQAQIDIKNFMSYTLDVCKDSFTYGQRKRAWDALTNLRGFVPKCGPVV